MIQKRGVVTILPKDWKEDLFLNTKVDLVKTDTTIEEITSILTKTYCSKDFEGGVITKENEKKWLPVFLGEPRKNKVKTHIIVSNTITLNVLQFLSEIDHTFVWYISNGRVFSYDFIDKVGNKEEKKTSKKE